MYYFFYLNHQPSNPSHHKPPTSSIPTGKSTPNSKIITQNNHPPPKTTTTYGKLQPKTTTTHDKPTENHKPTPVRTPINKPQNITNSLCHHRETLTGRDEKEAWEVGENPEHYYQTPSSRHHNPTAIPLRPSENQERGRVEKIKRERRNIQEKKKIIEENKI